MTEPTELEKRVAQAIAGANVNRKERCCEPGDRVAWVAAYAEDYWSNYLPEARAAIAECFKWQPIETAPRDGREMPCWRQDWDGPCFLRWKTNPRLQRETFSWKALTPDEEEWLQTHPASYFGDPGESDDYDLATKEGAPTHYFPLPAPNAEE